VLRRLASIQDKLSSGFILAACILAFISVAYCYRTGKVGTTPHLELFGRATGVPCRGTTQAMNDLVGGRSRAGWATPRGKAMPPSPVNRMMALSVTVSRSAPL